MAPSRENRSVTARSARTTEWEAGRDLVARTGQDVGLYELLTRVDPEHRPEFIRVVDVGGRLAGLVLVVPRRVIIAGTAVEGALLALAGVDPAERGRGLARLLLEDTMVYLGSRGFRVAMVHGAPELFGRFGFVPSLGNYATTFRPSNLTVSGRVSQGEVRPGDGNGSAGWFPPSPEDVPHLSSLYERGVGWSPGSVLRPGLAWVWETRPPGSGGILVFRPRGGSPPTGYVRVATPTTPGMGGATGTLTVVEVAAADYGVLEQCLSWTGRRAIESGLGRVRFTGPPDHEFSRLAYLRVGAEVARRPATSGQLAITNRGLLLADVASRLAGRAVSAGLEPGTRLVLDVGSKRIDLTFSGGQVRLLGGRANRSGESRVTELSTEVFTWLMVGYAGGADLGGLSGARVVPEHQPVLTALFPRSFPKWVPAPYW